MITGAAGFVGSHVLAHLLEAWPEAEFVCLDRLDSSGTMERVKVLCNEDDLRDRVTFIWHDLKAEINGHVRQKIGHVTHVLHLAASSHVDRSIADPLSFVMDNVVGTCNLLRWAHWGNPPVKTLYFSTDEVFGSAPHGIAYKEWDRYNSGNPYAASKAGAEELALAFHNTYRLPLIITHTMNVFGPAQHEEKFIPLVIEKTITGEKINIHSDPTRTFAGSRFYIHAREVARALQMLIERDIWDGEKYNIVGSEEIDNEELVKRIGGILGLDATYELTDFHSSRPGHDLRYALDGTKMREIGFTPTPLQDQLKDTVKWYLKNRPRP